MKGAPPTPSYLKKVIPLIKKLGYSPPNYLLLTPYNSGTGLLIEWEDTLPYKGELEVLRGQVTYSEEEIKEIINIAHYYGTCPLPVTRNITKGLTVIPLIPTIGHLEFVLKHEEFRVTKISVTSNFFSLTEKLRTAMTSSTPPNPSQ
jgi:hexosaminidase